MTAPGKAKSIGCGGVEDDGVEDGGCCGGGPSALVRDLDVGAPPLAAGDDAGVERCGGKRTEATGRGSGGSHSGGVVRGRLPRARVGSSVGVEGRQKAVVSVALVEDAAEE